MNEIDRELLGALAAGRPMLRKLAHWSGRFSADPVSGSRDELEYAALVPGTSGAPDGAEVVYVERSRLAVGHPEFFYGSAARWWAIKRVDPEPLRAESARTRISVDGAIVDAFVWDLPPSRLYVAVHGDVRIEVWAPSDVDVVVVPVADTDTVGLSWRTIEERGQSWGESAPS